MTRLRMDENSVHDEREYIIPAASRMETEVLTIFFIFRFLLLICAVVYAVIPLPRRIAQTYFYIQKQYNRETDFLQDKTLRA